MRAAILFLLLGSACGGKCALLTTHDFTGWSSHLTVGTVTAIFNFEICVSGEYQTPASATADVRFEDGTPIGSSVKIGPSGSGADEIPGAANVTFAAANPGAYTIELTATDPAVQTKPPTQTQTVTVAR